MNPHGAHPTDMEETLDRLEAKERSGGIRYRGFWREVGTLGRLARAVAEGRYSLATPQIVALLATLGYVVSPVDAAPDLLPVVGLADDAAVVAFTLASLAYELACFRAWEEQGAGESS